MNKNKHAIVVPFGLIIGTTIGLFLDIYQINVFGDVGLGIVFMPLVGLFLGIVVSHFLDKKSSL
ncbi:hypothetical protein [Thalassotalea agarivorans]|uniref:Uncharacterized protein n=1 Tax=Thalassotalea agarivorans TaxID=349064 RepID=A0A1I0E847_THASX|nr:hypothetical protein [Thalassotalea agarivorans]SET40479.1 hypothetical protein SAMN05660429_01740 [Thalassotalea agarivorans]